MFGFSEPYKLGYKPQGGLFYGIRGLIFMWHGEWAAPEVYDVKSGLVFNYFDLENPLWEEYIEMGGDDNDDEAFYKFVRENTDILWDTIDFIKSYFSKEK